MSTQPCGCDPEAHWTCALHEEGLEEKGPITITAECPNWENPVAKLETEVVVGDELMAEAWDLTNGDRAQAYGPAEQVFENYALIMTGLFQHKLREALTGADMTIFMTALKLAREAHSTGKRDNVVDAHGYLSILARLRGWITRGV